MVSSSGSVIDACTVTSQLNASVMVRLYVPALNPEKSKLPPSVVTVN